MKPFRRNHFQSVKFSSTTRRSVDDATPSTTNTKILRVSRFTADQVSREQARLEMLKKENERRLDTVCDEKEARMLEDEQLALLMQNKEFIRWLRKEQLRNPSYISPSSHFEKAYRKRYSSGKEHDVYYEFLSLNEVNSGHWPVRKATGENFLANISSENNNGPRVPEGPIVDELIINAEPDLKDRLKNMSRKLEIMSVVERIRDNCAFRFLLEDWLVTEYEAIELLR
ncbi:unnamed protein product [Angiostrongylus costaricensis]|uniref:DUF3350 domain-containing protein n=1 Tax=Angiostrongylus costaricensis TaxID=334426 RepID=A0A158PLG7_ANGCS|nr:unnamed protein product [Angiostrongylus costaricensis]